jgi:tripartite-type tricarboxylate transporter receptor subunit TctC
VTTLACIAVCVTACAALCSPAFAQSPASSWPTKPVRIVVGFPPAGATDVAARVLGTRLAELTGQSFLIDNRPGAASNIGAEAVARAAPDGYTLLMGSISLAINPSLYAKLAYDPLKDLLPVSQVASTPFLLVVNPAVRANTVTELIALAKAKPGEINYASAGSGSGAHLFSEMFRSMAGIDIVHVPYKGAAPAIQDVVGGQVPMQFDNILSLLPMVKAGKLRALAVTTVRRSPVAPDVPTVAESGLPGYDANAWFGLFATAGTSANNVRAMHALTAKALQDAGVRERMLALGADPVGSTPEAFAQFFRAELAKWAKVIKSAGARVD